MGAEAERKRDNILQIYNFSTCPYRNYRVKKEFAQYLGNFTQSYYIQHSCKREKGKKTEIKTSTAILDVE